MTLPRVTSFLSLNNLPFWLLVAAVAIPYYAYEPAPADLLGGLAIALWLGLVLFRKQSLRLDRYDWLLLGLVLLIVLQEAFNHAANLRFTMISLYLFGAYLAVKHYVISQGRVVWFFRAYLLSSVITVLVMAVQLVATYSFGLTGMGLYFDRPDGLFKDANVAGPALLLAVIFCQYFYLKTRRPLYWVGMLFFTCGVLLSFSRGAYLGLAGSVVLTLLVGYWLMVRLRQSSARSYGMAAIVILASLPILWFGLRLYQPFDTLAVSRFGTLLHSYDTSGRMVSWSAGLHSFVAHPFGTGSGSYEADSQAYQQQLVAGHKQSTSSSLVKRPKTASAAATVKSGDHVVDADGNEIIVTPSAHNTFIRVLKENGIFGFGLLVSFLALFGYSVARHVWRYRQTADPAIHSLAILAIGAAAIVPMGTFIDTLHWRILWYILGALGGLAFGMTRGEPLHETTTEKDNP